MRKIKVVFFAEILIPDFDGASRTIFQLLDRIDASRFDFLFVCGSGPDRINQFDCIKTRSISIPLNPKYKLAIPSLTADEIRVQLDQFKPDVVHIATPSLLGHFAMAYAKERQLPVISIYHTHFPSYIAYYFNALPFLIKPLTDRLTTIQNRFYEACKKVYVPSLSLAEELVATGMSAGNIKIWQRGIDTTLFSPDKKDPQYLKNLTNNALPTILFASRLVWEKNLVTLIAVYNTLRTEGFRCNWVIAGDGTAMKDCMRQMPGAIFVGKMDHDALSVLYASASVFIFPSISETFGNVVLEAMASGLVPIIADGGGSKDIVVNGVNGFKCEPDNANEYADKIRILLQDETLRKEMAANAVSHSKAFDWEQLAKVYFDDLHELATSVTENLEI
ncbi:glycosyltransferase family 4 protein [Dyadobacter fanqingshengii]|uniref:Glycosyltransferase family 1 protein n=1 Tax=Dyadobacter fanqingshengii TaxID=2906443 RepID=A0A9X1TAA0_9BACT|nr:glycosyltransferase family 1 protein [Dyadobacter fanqingshengii]MCF0041511.1 glycosyltransferase family 1 protein [Dyadobacter fanqingshengii]USJ36770.1 glycosyltransferase family 1 protein [Dyadobacter fanqingshengii]